MNVTKLSGWILLLMALAYAGISLMDFGPEYSAAGYIGANAEKFGLKTTDTNLRFQMGWEFVIDILIIGVMSVLGWWLTTQEVPQFAWIGVIGAFLIFSIVVRASPVLPLNIAKLSPGAAFYGAQVEVVVTNDVTNRFVPITRKDTIRVVTAAGRDGRTDMGTAALNLKSHSVAGQYQGCTLPLTIKGTVSGTTCLAYENKLETVPQITVQSCTSGLPQPK